MKANVGDILMAVTANSDHISHIFFLQVFAYDYCFWSMDESQQDKFAGWYSFTVSVCFCTLDLASTLFSSCVTLLTGESSSVYLLTQCFLIF